MLDRDLAELYGVETRVLNQAVTRNLERFPNDFMFELDRKEIQRISQIVISSKIKYSRNVRVFTEQGVAMLSSVLRSKRAIQVNIQIMRAFTELRQMLSTHTDLKRKLEAMEKKYDKQFKIVFEAIKQLLEADEKPKKKIGFTVKEKSKSYGKRKAKIVGGDFSLTSAARKIWEAIPGDIQIKILNNVLCASCKGVTSIGKVNGKVEKGMLILKGSCTRCGGPVARVIENE